jgi:hypothetical protein
MLRLPNWSRPLTQDYPSNSYSAEGNWDGCVADDETKKKMVRSRFNCIQEEEKLCSNFEIKFWYKIYVEIPV